VNIDLEPEGGGVLIAGDEDELRALAGTMLEAAVHGDAVGQFLTPLGVEMLSVVCTGAA
jgi:hypothetical protein